MKKLILCFVLLLGVYWGFGQAPTIAGFSPDSGSVGTLVTIIGTNLNSPTAFSIGGISAIVVSGSADTLVGMVMPGATTGAVSVTTAGGTGSGSGSFIITPTSYLGGQQGPKLVGTGAVGTDSANLGSSVSLSADGNTAIVGGPGDNGTIGAVWAYTRSGGTWSQQGPKIVGTGVVGPYAWQGCSVSLSADGDTALVGGWYDNSGIGAAWVYIRSGGTWTQQGSKLVGTGAVGAAHQGCSVSLSADGNTAIVGGLWDDSDVGAAWVYTRSGGIWTQQGTKLVGTGAVGTAYQGGSVSLSADGNTAIVGGYIDNNYVGAAWVYTRSGGIWTQQGSKLVGTGAVGDAQQGSSVSLSADGNTAIEGGYDDNSGIGAVWVFTRSGTTWTQQGAKLVGTGDVGPYVYQGISVSLSADGNTAMEGGYDDNNGIGAVWVYTRSGTTWTQQGGKLTATGAVAGYVDLGVSGSLSADGSTAIMGGPCDNLHAGAAWVFISCTPSYSSDTLSICPAALPYTWNGLIWNGPGSQTAYLTSGTGCDSIATLVLSVIQPIYTDTTTQTICSGDSLLFGGTAYYATGYYSHYLNPNNCDSIVTLNLTVLTPNTLYDTIFYETFGTPGSPATGWTLNVGSGALTGVTNAADSNYWEMDDLEGGQAVGACGGEGTATGNGNNTLYITENQTAINAFTQIVVGANCALGGCTYLADDAAGDLCTSGLLCVASSVMAISPVINTSSAGLNPMSLNFEYITGGDNQDFLSIYYTINGGATWTLLSTPAKTPGSCAGAVTPPGCSAIYPGDTQSRSPWTQVTPIILPLVCNNANLQIGFNWQNPEDDNGTPNPVSAAIDNVIITTGQARAVDSVTICQGASYIIGSQNFTVSGSYPDSLTGSYGCDSIVSIVLTVIPASGGSISQGICQGASYTFNGQNLSTSGTYYDTLTSVSGCDSIVTLTLSVNNFVTGSISAGICPGGSFTFDGQNLSNAGIYYDTLTSVYGCDSIVTLTLTVYPNTASSFSQSICQGNTYVFGGQNLFAAGTYFDTLTSMHGCDSIVTLTLTLNPSSASSMSQTLCPGGFYIFDTQFLTAAGTYYDTLASVTGCDSVVTLSLTEDSVTAFFTLQASNIPHLWYVVNQCTGTGPLTCTWYWGDSTSSIGDTPSHTYADSGFYTVCVSVSDSLGCSASYCDTNAFLFKNGSGSQMVYADVVYQVPNGINTIAAQTLAISYYGGAVHFSQPLQAPTSLGLYDLEGREILSQDGFSGSVWPIPQGIAQGVYIIRLENTAYSLSEKLTVLR